MTLLSVLRHGVNLCVRRTLVRGTRALCHPRICLTNREQMERWALEWGKASQAMRQNWIEETLEAQYQMDSISLPQGTPDAQYPSVRP